MASRARRSMAAWAALLAAASVTIAVQLRSAPEASGHDPHAADAAAMLIDAPLTDWSVLDLLNEGQRVRFERDPQGRWFRHAEVAGEAAGHAHRSDPAESERIDQVLATLSRARIERSWPADPLQAGTFGLANPALIALVQGRDGRTLLTMEFGDLAADGLSRYVRVPQTKQLHTVPAYHLRGLLSLVEPPAAAAQAGAASLPQAGRAASR